MGWNNAINQTLYAPVGCKRMTRERAEFEEFTEQTEYSVSEFYQNSVVHTMTNYPLLNAQQLVS